MIFNKCSHKGTNFFKVSHKFPKNNLHRFINMRTFPVKGKFLIFEFDGIKEIDKCFVLKVNSEFVS